MKFYARLALAALLAPPVASAQPRVAHRDAGVHPADVPDASTDVPAPSLCCCRAWSHGWQYTWRDASSCAGANGTCVSPDHC